jgi:hypothetical protein
LINAPELVETLMRGLAVRNLSPQEFFWSTARWGGLEPNSINVQGWSPGPFEVFEVACPLDGLVVHGSRTVGDIRLTDSGRVRALSNRFEDSDLFSEYHDAGCWALTLVSARTIFDAEVEGLRKIESSVAWVAARASYSRVSLPDGEIRNFARGWSMARPRPRDVVAVRGIRTQRRWLRSPRSLTVRSDLQLETISDFDTPSLGTSLTGQEREAIAAWRRAIDADDPIAAVGALWEALEFYAFDAEVPEPFPKETLQAAIENAVAGLDEEQAKRMRTALQDLNRPTIFEALKVANERDRVPIKAKERAVLRRTRLARNEYTHGRSRDLPNPDDVRYAVALVDRMLVYRVHRRALEASVPQRGWG